MLTSAHGSGAENFQGVNHAQIDFGSEKVPLGKSTVYCMVWGWGGVWPQLAEVSSVTRSTSARCPMAAPLEAACRQWA